MAWITPKTDWAETDYFTYVDANRIAGNLNHIYPTAALKDDYDDDDVVTASEWTAVLGTLDAIISATGYTIDAEALAPSMIAAAYNFNTVESLTQSLKDWIELLDRQHAAAVFTGDNLYTSGVPENYSRS